MHRWMEDATGPVRRRATFPWGGLDGTRPLRPEADGDAAADVPRFPPRLQWPVWSERSLQLFSVMEIPVSYRDPAPYHRAWVDRYQPNQSSLLPPLLADALHRAARWDPPLPPGELPADVLADFLVDFSWSSAALEDCRHTRAETAALFRLAPRLQALAASHSVHARLLVNHKAAVERLMLMTPHGLDARLIQDLHSRLMDGLLAPALLGRLRRTPARVAGSAFEPSPDARLLAEMLVQIAEKAAAIRNPVEAAFFLWLQVSYLQAFADGNTRTARLCANVPLLRRNCVPLSFDDVAPSDYGVAMLGVYERNDVSAAADLFEWLYRRSIQKYLSARSDHARDPRQAL